MVSQKKKINDTLILKKCGQDKIIVDMGRP